MDTTERYESGQAEELVARVRALHDSGHRLVQIGCLEISAEAPTGENVNGSQPAEKRLEIIYSFDKDYRLTHLRLSIGAGDRVPSVSSIYDMAFLYENEIHDLFGVQIDGISLDFKGTFYQKEIARPFCSTNGSEAN